MALPDPAVSAPDDTSTVSWHAETAAAVAHHLEVDTAAGLSDEEAARRLLEHGPNQLSAVPGRPAWKRFADQ